MRYYSRRWDEDRGDAFARWGASQWFFETDDEGNGRRQVEVYKAGPTLRYDVHDRRGERECERKRRGGGCHGRVFVFHGAHGTHRPSADRPLGGRRLNTSRGADRPSRVRGPSVDRPLALFRVGLPPKTGAGAIFGAKEGLHTGSRLGPAAGCLVDAAGPS